MSSILITGATGSIGINVCNYLAEKGYSLIIVARNPDKLAILSNQLKAKHNANVNYYTCDFSSIETINTLASKMAENPIDGVVLMPPQIPPTNDCLPEPEVWQQIFNASFIGPEHLLKKLLPNLLLAKGCALLISGISSVQPLSNYATSNVLRTMWGGLMKTAADKYGPEGVRFNTLSLGGVITEPFKIKIAQEASAANMTFSDILKQRVANVPLRRYAELEEITEMIAFLLTSKACVHMTGQNIRFDGGFTRPYV